MSEENTSIIDEHLNSNETLSLKSRDYLLVTAKWGYFLSIIGFIFIAIIVVVAFSIGTILENTGAAANMPVPGFALASIYLILALIYFFPTFYLFKFSSLMKSSLVNDDLQGIEDGFKNLKSCFKFMGIFTIIILGFYLLMFLFGMIGMTL